MRVVVMVDPRGERCDLVVGLRMRLDEDLVDSVPAVLGAEKLRPWASRATMGASSVP